MTDTTIQAAAPASHPIRRQLADWTVTALDGPVPRAVRQHTIPATVPGSVHTDLLAAGLIPDPYLDGNEQLLGWIGLTDWRYSTTFVWQPDSSTQSEIVFDGLDTIATVELNGHRIGVTRNMHRRYRFDLRTHLRAGLNELAVTFSSPIRAADAASLDLGYRPHVNHHPYNAIRKMACSFGWDWGIDTSTSGIWRPVALECWATARLESVRPIAIVDPLVRADGTARHSGTVAVHVEVARASDADLIVTASVGGVAGSATLSAGQTSAVVTLHVAEVSLWWPRGYGEQRLYDVDVTLHGPGADDAEALELDSAQRRVGFRTVSFDTEPDATGTPFTIAVNGQPVFVRGANWIPDDSFPHRVDRDRYRDRIEQAEFANINLLRVWGGGIFEADDFFELCDERGMLTWQDFLLACAAYAEEAPLFDEIEAEARDNVARLASHPSLIVLNGNNENLWGHEEWNWKTRLDGKTWGAGYYYELFPRIVAELAPHIGYTPGSPFTPGGTDGLGRDGTLTPNDRDNGTMHIWDLWNQRDYPAYREHTPRFVAEFGWQGPPTWSTMRASISDSPLTPESPGMLVHQKAMEGNVKLTDGLLAHYPLPDDIDAWHWAMSLNQAKAIGTAIEHFRSLQPHCMGSIVWQLNDCWPVTSWAAVDGYGRPKPLLYAIRHAYADRLVTIQPRAEGTLAAVVVNDEASPWSGELIVRRLTDAGIVLAEHAQQVTLPARSTVTVPLPASVSETTNAAAELLRAELTGVRGHWFFAEPRDTRLGAPSLSSSLERVPNGYLLTVTAATLTRDLAVLVDKVDPSARVDDMLITLLPGESATFTVCSEVELDCATLTAPTVLRSANQLMRP
ncbi:MULTISPECIES: glycoside hydrolase family 2 protein [unclassified Cryobacterium]|uniref:glycoside hydrolase family 2 protein n=1 Tax=unclassified Cryobacterium TaxID=2649013 RepID=UPI002AB33AE2|nr:MULTISPECIES: glycoside hydrolase family 2 protein [unclassified Cryobacterium]MDY7543069.1 glycoside hydrolase family 2 protein [Cryobacterium sp. 5B3]MEB0000245.1 glycoside hydrolase family 2 protein [Cryobacterium sp. RTS3]MEB0267162.1 glycoside hydrolase family 2 protein [Cryobacterium sp. 10I5]MEB0274480.1 glycoside hydrolase family 2 protein [Cryobacterium sp. 5B3]